ncbi:hypothetical protein ACFQU7_31915 [Pseudoroseomonas wenyumeiae]
MPSGHDPPARRRDEMSDDIVLLEVKDHIALVTLNKPRSMR